MSQASVSELVRRLELEAGLVLFARGGRRLVPTSAGEQLRPFAEQAVAAAAAGERALRSLGSLEGGVASFGLFLLLAVLTAALAWMTKRSVS